MFYLLVYNLIFNYLSTIGICDDANWCRKVLEERNTRSSDNSFYFRIYIIVLGVYAALRLVVAMLMKLPACHTLSEMSDQSFFQFFKWIYQVRVLKRNYLNLLLSVWFLKDDIHSLSLPTPGTLLCRSWSIWKTKWLLQVYHWLWNWDFHFLNFNYDTSAIETSVIICDLTYFPLYYSQCTFWSLTSDLIW